MRRPQLKRTSGQQGDLEQQLAMAPHARPGRSDGEFVAREFLREPAFVGGEPDQWVKEEHGVCDRAQPSPGEIRAPEMGQLMRDDELQVGGRGCPQGRERSGAANQDCPT